MFQNVPEHAVFGFDTHQISAIAPPRQPQPPTPTPNAMDHSPARDTLTDADEGLVPALLLALTEQT